MIFSGYVGLGSCLGPTAKRNRGCAPAVSLPPNPKHGAEPLPQIRIVYNFRWIRQSRARSRKGNHRNHTYYQRHAVLPDSKKKTLLVATRRIIPITSPTSAVKWKESGVPEQFFIFLFFLHFLFLDSFNISKIKWTKFEEKRNFRGRWVSDLGLGSAKKILGALLPSPVPPNPKHVAEPLSCSFLMLRISIQ